MEKDNSIPEVKTAITNNCVEAVKDLVARIKFLESEVEHLKNTLQQKQEEKETFQQDWQEKCTHPDFFKITLLAEEGIDKNSKYYLLTKALSRGRDLGPKPEVTFYECPVCGLCKDEPQPYVKELTLHRSEYRHLKLEPVSDLAQTLSKTKTMDFALLESEIKDLSLEKDQLVHQLDELLNQAYDISNLLYHELGIAKTETKYVRYCPDYDPDRYYND